MTTEGRFLAAVKACGDDAALSHYAAACFYGWLKYNGRPVDVTCRTRRRRPGIKTHETDVLERELVRQILVTPRLRTIVDLSRVEDERTVKRALRQAKFTEDELQQLPRTGLIGGIVDLSAAHTASGNEDFVLDLVLKAGFVHPRVNAPYQLPGQTYYPDLWWPDVRLIVEVDSREFHDGPIDQRDDLDRQAWLEAEGERVLRTTKAQVERDPPRFLARLTQAGAPQTRPAQTQL
ncbi:endonuclease domain-containing protein [Solirubrobacter phytolaccae]|uniref:Endonuclease domain-containing protein n=1 Tax=Solirubrobacter phytolaccae TaxID=1404360 RepID=A0A9X3NCU3_9ACTN|nr:endonuclease domain-containing protein [Solirubrobacter phytolaccae]